MAAFLHPEGPYDDPKGGALREACIRGCGRIFSFINELQLFAEVDHRHEIQRQHLRSAQRGHPRSTTSPTCSRRRRSMPAIAHDGQGLVGGIQGRRRRMEYRRPPRSHRSCDRRRSLAMFAQLYDEPGTPARRARLPALHAGTLNSVLEKLASYPRRLGIWAPTISRPRCGTRRMQQRDGTIRREHDAGFPTSPEDWVLSGPHFFLANPFNKTPRRVCTANGHYDVDRPRRHSRRLPCRARTTGPWPTAPNTCAARHA